MKEPFIHIERVEKRSVGEYRVYYADEFGLQTLLSVAASDELDAYTKATKFIQRRINVQRHLIWAASLVLCLLIAVTGYGCTRPEVDVPTDMEKCVAQGGSYFDRGAADDTPAYVACIKGGTHAREGT